MAEAEEKGTDEVVEKTMGQRALEAIGPRDAEDVPPTPPVEGKPKEEKKDEPKDKTVPLAALTEVRGVVKDLRLEIAALKDRESAARDEMRKQIEEVKSGPAKPSEVDEFLKANAEDPFVKAHIAQSERLEQLEAQLKGVNEAQSMAASSNAEEWVTDQIDGIATEYPELKKDLLTIGDAGEMDKRLADFFSWAAEKRLSSEDEFRRGFDGFFAGDIRKVIEDRVKGKSVERSTAARRASTTIAAPGKVGGSPSMFSGNRELRSRVEERLAAQGSR